MHNFESFKNRNELLHIVLEPNTGWCASKAAGSLKDGGL